MDEKMFFVNDIYSDICIRMYNKYTMIIVIDQCYIYKDEIRRIYNLILVIKVTFLFVRHMFRKKIDFEASWSLNKYLFIIYTVLIGKKRERSSGHY